MTGPLSGMKVVELEGIGPAPFCGMLLADLGAEVVSVGRKSSSQSRQTRISERGKRTVALNLKAAEAIEIVLRLCERADALIEGFRPGVMERLGLGPDICFARNRKLVYGRMTGWGQDGPLAQAAGHDINYIALSGALHAIGRKGERPVPPLNLVGDFGGGGMFLAFGLMCAIFEAQRSGRGQVVDVSMVEGAASLMHMMYAMHANGTWVDRRESNVLDGAAPYYDTYETSDGKYISIGSIEPQFYELLMKGLEGNVADFSPQNDTVQWPARKARFSQLFKARTREEWCRRLEGTDVCFAPVLSMAEAPDHPHNVSRGSFLRIDGVVQPAPAPGFTRTQNDVPRAPLPSGQDTDAVLRELGYDHAQVRLLRERGAVT